MLGKTAFDNTIQVLNALLLDSSSCLWTASDQNPYFTESLVNIEDISQIMNISHQVSCTRSEIPPESEKILVKINVFPQYIFLPPQYTNDFREKQPSQKYLN